MSRRAIDAACPSAATTLTVGEVGGRLADVSVGDVMLRDPLVVGLTTPLAEALRLMRDVRADVLVVCDQEEVVGVLTVSDLLRLLGRLTSPERSA